MAVTPLRERKAWQALERHYEEIAGRRDLWLRTLDRLGLGFDS